MAPKWLTSIGLAAGLLNPLPKTAEAAPATPPAKPVAITQIISTSPQHIITVPTDPQAQDALDKIADQNYADQNIRRPPLKTDKEIHAIIDMLYQRMPSRIPGITALPPKPVVYMIDNDEINAFALCTQNRDKDSPLYSAIGNAAILIITSEALKMENREILTGTLAHELGHAVVSQNYYLQEAYQPPDPASVAKDMQANKISTPDDIKSYYREMLADTIGVELTRNAKAQNGIFPLLEEDDRRSDAKAFADRVAAQQATLHRPLSDAEKSDIQKSLQLEQAREKEYCRILYDNPHPDTQVREEAINITAAAFSQQPNPPQSPWMTPERLEQILSTRGMVPCPLTDVKAAARDSISKNMLRQGIASPPPIFVIPGDSDSANPTATVKNVAGMPYVQINEAAHICPPQWVKDIQLLPTDDLFIDQIQSGKLVPARKLLSPKVISDITAMEQKTGVNAPVFIIKSPTIPLLEGAAITTAHSGAVIATAAIETLPAPEQEAMIALHLAMLPPTPDKIFDEVAEQHNDPTMKYRQILQADKTAAALLDDRKPVEQVIVMEYASEQANYLAENPGKTAKDFVTGLKRDNNPLAGERVAALEKAALASKPASFSR